MRKITMSLSVLDERDVRSVYSGRPGCYCGCRGNHRYNPAHRAEASRDRGYLVEDREVNLTQVRKVFRLLRDLPPDALAQNDAGLAAARIDGREYCVYFTERVEAARAAYAQRERLDVLEDELRGVATTLEDMLS